MKILQEVKASLPSLAFPYDDYPFSAVTFNLGPDACTKPHKDSWDLTWGWCAVTSLGNFDHTKGGHLVLWDLGMVVEFPPHSTILFPSTIITHSNTAIQDGEWRSSVTQYNVAGLFRWVAYGHSLNREGPSGTDWWDNFNHMFSTSRPR